MRYEIEENGAAWEWRVSGLQDAKEAIVLRDGLPGYWRRWFDFGY